MKQKAYNDLQYNVPRSNTFWYAYFIRKSLLAQI